MAINIKELFNADADNIKVDKINYNFDQILANGGGPIGAKGSQGTTGNTGTKGQKGELGNKGNVGSKGEQGASANLWDSDTIASTTGTNINILRPYNASTSQDGEEDLRTRIILGQATSNPNDTTPAEPTALLNLILPPENNDDTTSQIIFINDETGDPREFKMATSYEQGTGSTFTFSALAATAGERTNLSIQIPNNITINANSKVEINSASLIEIGDINTDPVVNIFAEQDILIQSAENITIRTDDTLSVVSVDRVDIGGNDININSVSGTIDLSSPQNTITATNNGENYLTATGGENYLISESNKLNANAVGEANVLNTTSTGGENILRNSGNDKFKTSDSINTSTQNVFFSMPNRNHDGTPGSGTTGAGHGDGIQFKEGDPGESLVDGNTANPAPNYGSSIDERTLSDYFEGGSINLWNNSAGHIKKLDTTSLGVKEWYSGANWDACISNDLFLGAAVGSITYNNWGVFNYTKIGNVIHGNGYVRVSGAGDGSQAANIWVNSNDENRMALIIDLNNTDAFPYVNNSGAPCIVDISIGGSVSDPDGYNIINGEGNSGGEWQNPHSGLNSVDPALSSIRDIIRVKGIIPAGRNEIAIVYDSMNPGYDSVGGLQNDIFTLGFAPSFVSGGYPVTFNFSFTMLTSWDSYNRIIIDTSAPPLDDVAESPASPEGGASSGGEAIGGENLDDNP